MPTDLNRPFLEALESDDADYLADIAHARYDPPIPYDYRQQWSDNPVEWAVSYAANQIRQFDGGSDFYKNLDSATIETWVFDDYPDLLWRLREGRTLEGFRSRLSQHCRMLQAAALLANEVVRVRQGMSNPFAPSIPLCEEFFPEWLATIQAKPEWSWQAHLPGCVAELCGKWRDKGYSRHSSEDIVPHSEAPSWDFPIECNKQREGVTAYLLERASFPLSIKACTNERFALVLRAPTGTDIGALTKFNRTALSIYQPESRQASWDLSFGNGVLSLSVLEHEDSLLKFKNHVPVIFHFDGKKLLAEYDWNPIAYGRDYLRLAKETNPVADSTGLPPRMMCSLHPAAIRIERICSMPTYRFPGEASAETIANESDDDCIPF